MKTFKDYINEDTKTLFNFDVVKVLNSLKNSENIKKWYTKNYKSDDLGKEIKSKYNFQDACYCIMNGDDIYDDLLGVGDSTVRERVLQELARLLKPLGVTYDNVYETWMLSARKSLLKHYHDMKGWSSSMGRWK